MEQSERTGRPTPALGTDRAVEPWSVVVRADAHANCFTFDNQATHHRHTANRARGNFG